MEYEFRNQVLPSDERWEYFKKVLEHKDMRMIVIDKTYWHNALTRCKGVIHNMPIIACSDNSSRTIAITKIIYSEWDNATKCTREPEEWLFNDDYHHTNINGSGSTFTINDSGMYPDEGSKWYHQYKIHYHEICCPISSHHMYERNLDELKMIFVGQLQGQNGGSPFRHVNSVANNYYDGALMEITGGFIKRTASVLQLLTRQSLYNITNAVRSGTVRNMLNSTSLPVDESEVMVKLCLNTGYTKAKVTELDELKEKCLISNYYNVITYEQCKEMLSNIPKVQSDITCIGLGSAGSGILDQVARGNWFNSFTLIDFDTVEEKNLRNQWYVRSNIGYRKSTCSADRIRWIKGEHNANVVAIDKKFQEAGLEGFESKYLISGFDSIECRLELLDYVQTGKTSAKYIIDTRYDDLSASIFFVDTSNEAEMEYYKAGLISDKEAFDALEDKDKVKDLESFMQYVRDAGIYESGCSSFRADIAKDEPLRSCHVYDCGCYECDSYFEMLFAKYEKECIDYCNTHKVTRPAESSCVKQNLIDIYKFASSFVFSAIREIEDGEAKPFTHVEATTEKLPTAMVVRK